jgi:hypothetical protein
MNPNAQSGDGGSIHNGTGHVGVYYRDPAGTAHAAAAFALQSGAGGGNIEFSANPTSDLDAIGIRNFVAIWMTVRESTTTLGTYDVNVYLNGSTATSSEVGGVGIALQSGPVDFGAGVVNYLALGSNSTGDDAMVEIESFAYKLGVHAPSSTPCQSSGESFRRGDADGTGIVNITDGIFILNFLFLGGPTPLCLDSADANDDGLNNITDGIFVLNYLFLGGPTPPAPGPQSCGTDTVSDSLAACVYTKC